MKIKKKVGCIEMEATMWALLPPILAIIISLITKEVNLSLLVGILVGAGLYCGFNPFTTLTTTYDVMSTRVYGNLGVLYFIILLGMIVHLMNLSGATHEYAKWASKKLKTKRQTLLATMFLGIIIFVDDYFNCLTVGTVMRPITDRNKVSREKLAYIIDSTAAPVCIIAPISSWAAAVSSSLPEGSSIDGFQLFMKSIFCNYYSWFSLIMVFLVIVFTVDFGKMKKYEKAAMQGTYIYTKDTVEETENTKGKVIDLILPVVAIIVFSIISMLYTGEFFDGGISLGDAFANCNAITGLAMGAGYTVIFVALLYIPRKIVTPKQFLDGLVEGFIHMVPATLILTFAWTLSGICGADYLNAGGFVADLVSKYNISLILMPAIFFIIALLLAFSTGTSWGTFATLLPITVSVFNDVESSLMVMTTAAVLGGSVCGDHISPISDTTILSSTGAGCEHINHVSTQLQYGVIVAIVTVIAYLISAITNKPVTGMGFGIIALLIITFSLRNRTS
ncbi:MAG: Na+/H+ antiporter NhaC family protein [Anaerostipes sp.]